MLLFNRVSLQNLPSDSKIKATGPFEKQDPVQSANLFIYQVDSSSATGRLRQKNTSVKNFALSI